MKILHVLETSIPDLVGYTIRAKYIVENQKKHGMVPVVVTSPFFKRGNAKKEDEIINDIKYYRTNYIMSPDKVRNKIVSYLTRIKMLHMYKRAVLDIVKKECPDIIHAHSSYTNGMAANYASKKTGIPSIYEMRSLWGESAVVDEGLKPGSLKYKMIWKLEMDTIRNATMVVAISEGIKKEIAQRCGCNEKIHILPNGVDTNYFLPTSRDEKLLEKYNLHGCYVLGYIGSIRKLEGLNYLIKAFINVNKEISQARLLIVGDGSERKNLEKLSQDLCAEGKIIFTGKIPHDHILDYYSIIDTLVFPRINAKINQAVTPLKPLEAMSMGKVCIGSDVGGLKELIKNNYNGLLFESENERALADTIRKLMKDNNLYKSLKSNGMEWVKKERDWSVLIPRYRKIYKKILDQ